MSKLSSRIIVCVFVMLLQNSTAQTLRTFGVQINVPNMGKAIHFYHDVLGFGVGTISKDSTMVVLTANTGNDLILLTKVPYLLPAPEKEATATLTLQVNDLDNTIKVLTSKGLNFDNVQKRKEGVGYALYIFDPFGTRISLMHETVVANPHFEEPRVYNYGFYVSDIDKTSSFYKQLGFVIRSEKYLPLDLPLGHPDKTFAFMLHTRPGVEPIHYNSAENEHIVILFSCTNINETYNQLLSKNMNVIKGKIEDTPLGKAISVADPFGYISKIVQPK